MIPPGIWISWSGSEPAVIRPVLLSTVNQPVKVWVAPDRYQWQGH
jgi:hypothetical protein